MPNNSRSLGKARTMLYRVVEGYRQVFARLGAVVPLLLGIAVVSALVVVPLWYLATQHTVAYTLLVLLAAVVGLFYLLIKAFLNRSEGRTTLGRIGLTLVILLALYATLRLAALGVPLAALGTLLIALFLTGIAAAPKRRV